MHSRLYHSAVSNCQVSHNCCLLQYSLDLRSLDFLHIQNRALFDLHQTPNLYSNERKFHCDLPLEYDFEKFTVSNVVMWSICDSVKRNSDGKSSIFISIIPCWPSALKRRSQQDAQAAILACDWSRLLNVSWQSIASSCPMGLPIKYEKQFHVTDLSTSGCNLSLNIATRGSVEQQ